MKRAMFFPSSDGQEYAVVAGIPDTMTDDQAQQAANEVVEAFNKADAEGLEGYEEVDPPSFGSLLKEAGFHVFDSVLNGPTWD